ncbi:MAG: M28 family peptidase, partial [Bacteroidota bacterium]
WLLCFSLSLPAQAETIVATLSGHEPLPNGDILQSRWTATERQQTRTYLTDLFAQRGITLREQTYAMPNLYALQDLLLGPFRGANLYGVLPAHQATDEYVLLGAHYDTEKGAPGANDNASAMALLYGVVEQLSKLPQRRKNLLFIFFDQEEEDNVGSRAFIRFLRQQSWRIHSVHTVDQMGWDADGDRNVEVELPTPSLEKRYQNAARAMGITAYVTGVSASDHQAFRNAGYPAVGLTEEFAHGDTSPYKDSPADTYATVNFAFINSTTELVYRVFRSILTETEDDGTK